jgi:hypothetical protein
MLCEEGKENPNGRMDASGWMDGIVVNFIHRSFLEFELLEEH